MQILRNAPPRQGIGDRAACKAVDAAFDSRAVVHAGKVAQAYTLVLETSRRKPWGFDSLYPYHAGLMQCRHLRLKSAVLQVQILWPAPVLRKRDRAARCRFAKPRPATRLPRFDSWRFRHRGRCWIVGNWS